MGHKDQTGAGQLAKSNGSNQSVKDILRLNFTGPTQSGILTGRIA